MQGLRKSLSSSFLYARRASCAALTPLRSYNRAQPIAEDAIKQLFTEARTHYKFSETAIPKETLEKLYDIVKMGPTAFNCNPLRVTFVQSKEAKARLLSHAAEGNRPKISSAPVTAILSVDTEFYKKLPFLFPAADLSGLFSDANIQASNLNTNGLIQAGYFIIAARSLGLDVGAMAGFNPAGVDAEFHKGTTNKTILLVNLGYAGEPAYPRSPRFNFDEICKIE